ncbi:MAG: hypothetical protein F6K50_48650 [Moorea sp. SIO3I7]|uniref:hypothetical protein n=1 Tax=unclassified Moorena TaxID=2683338 RepID=UPI0013C7BB5D|nr:MULTISPECIES: hypothetical protein [unclassified Moorena]NEO02922.1 hypothetical protein [Moorena sp. SIO3I7]NEO42852.1 hypothetical protein [Moorena sp. SIO4A3]NEO64765.1 hypothetical protein [Moorena sp. SIO4G2]NEO24752.1 hypothetical protein [Moorena sp. SIO4A5]NEP27487.1 hypothetical protein [Moorena sp. SIO3I6]
MNRSRVGILPARKYSDAARSWEGSAVLGVPPMSDCRGFPHEGLHQDIETGKMPVPRKMPLERARCPFYRCDPRARAIPRALGGAHLLLKSFHY